MTSIKSLTSLLILHCCLLFAWHPVVLQAQEIPVAPAATTADPGEKPITELESDPTIEPAPLVIEHKLILNYRAKIFGIPPEDRASIAHDRFYELLNDKRITGKIAYQIQAEEAFITIDKRVLAIITKADLDPLGTESLEAAAELAVQQLQGAWQKGRSNLSFATIAWALIKAIIACLIYSALLFLANRLCRFWVDYLGQRTEQLLLSKSPRKPGWMKFIQLVVSNLYWVFFLALTLVWLTAILGYLPWTQSWGDYLSQYLLTAFEKVFQQMAHSIPGLLVVVVIMIVTHLLSQLCTLFFTEVAARRLKIKWLDPEVALPTQRIATVFLWIAAVVMAYPYLPGGHSEAFKGISVMIGVLLSLGSSSITAQMASGLLLLYSRTFRIGEFIRVGDQEGLLLGIGLVSTRLRSFTKEEILIPNSVMLSSTSHNYSRSGSSPTSMIQTTLTIGYTAPWRQVQALMKLAADQTPELRKEPAPFVVQTALSDFYVEYQLNAHLEQPMDQNHPLIRAALHARIQDLFNEHHIQIMSPHYLGDPAHPQVIPKERWHVPPSNSG